MGYKCHSQCPKRFNHQVKKTETCCKSRTSLLHLIWCMLPQWTFATLRHPNELAKKLRPSPMPTNMRSASTLLISLGLLSSCESQSVPAPENKIDRFQSVRLGSSNVIGLAMPRNITAQRMVTEARKICQGRDHCQILGSYDPTEIAMALAQPERQALIKEFRYSSKSDGQRETVEVNCQYYPDAEPDWCSK